MKSDARVIALRQPESADAPPWEIPPLELYEGEQTAVPVATRVNGHATPETAEPTALVIPPASTWAGRQPPPARDWIMPDFLPAARVTTFAANGGEGKTQIALQIAVHVARSASLWGRELHGGPVLGIFCEDEPDELERRVRSTCEAEGIDLSLLDNLYLLSRDGSDNLLCTFDRERIDPTPFHGDLAATVEAIRPRLMILDTVADLFGGDFMSTPQVRQFIKVGIGSFCVRYQTAAMLLAHPSASAMASGDGGGFSVAWNNSTRSRWFMRRPKSDDPEVVKDRRIIELRKANYAASGQTIPLLWQAGRFVLDLDPIDEGAGPVRIARAETGLSLAVMDVMRTKSAAGQIVTFRALYDALGSADRLGDGKPDAVRKRVSRTLTALVDEGLLQASSVPRGYRLVVKLNQEPV